MATKAISPLSSYSSCDEAALSTECPSPESSFTDLRAWADSSDDEIPVFPAFSYRVKNTFIDDIVECPTCTRETHRRSQSCPASPSGCKMLTNVLGMNPNKLGAVQPALFPKTGLFSPVTYEGHRRVNSRTSRGSCVSTASTSACSDQEREQDSLTRDDSNVDLFPQSATTQCKSCELSGKPIKEFIEEMGRDCKSYRNGKLEPAVKQLIQLMYQECSWLQLCGQELHRQADKHGHGRNLLSVRFYVRGLPWQRRPKWQLPLLWAVSAVFQRCGTKASMRGQELLVTLDNGATLRVDFVALRCD